MRCAIGLLALVTSACSSTEDVQEVRIRSVAFEMPAGWERTETTEPGATTIVWTPRDNPRKESIAVIYSDATPAVAKSNASTLQRLISAAQSNLPQVRASTATSFTTARGLSGVSIELKFVPVGSTAVYHRTHAVVSDGGAIVHVLYTARTPHASREAFNGVLKTIRHEES